MAETVIKKLVSRYTAEVDKGSFSSVTSSLSGVTLALNVVGQNVDKFKSKFTGFMGGAVRAFDEFSQEFQNLKTLVGLGTEEFDKMGNAITRIALLTGKADTELARAAFFITSNGIRGAKALELLEGSAKASRAGLGEVKDIANLAGSAMNTYGADVLSATNALDIMFNAVKQGNLDAATLAPALPMVLSQAESVGISFGHVAGSVAALSKSGLSASLATTQLRSFLTAISAGGSKAQKILKQLHDEGKDIPATFGELKKALQQDFHGTIVRIKQATGDDQGLLKGLLGRSEASQFVEGLTGAQADASSQVIASVVGESAGAVEDGFGKIKRGLADLKNTFNIFQGELGKIWSKALAPIIEGAIKLTTWLTKQPKLMGGLSIALGVLTGGLVAASVAIGALVTLFGIMAAVGPMKAALATIAAGLGKVKIAAMLTFRSITTGARLAWGATGIGLAVIAISLIVEHWDFLWRKMKEFFFWARDKAVGWMKPYEDEIKRFVGGVQTVWSYIRYFFSQITSNFFETVADTVTGYVMTYIDAIRTLGETAWGVLKLAFTGRGGEISSYLMQELGDFGDRFQARIGQRYESWMSYADWMGARQARKDAKGQAADSKDPNSETATGLGTGGVAAPVADETDIAQRIYERRRRARFGLDYEKRSRSGMSDDGEGAGAYRDWQRAQEANEADALALGQQRFALDASATGRALGGIRPGLGGVLDALLGGKDSLGKTMAQRLVQGFAKTRDGFNSLLGKIGLSALPGGQILAALGITPEKIFGGLFKGLKSLFGKRKRTMHNSGRDLIGAFRAGLDKGMKDFEPIKMLDSMFYELRRRLPSSDAEIGHLSDLTASGEAFATTLAAGIQRGLPELERMVGQISPTLALPTALPSAPVTNIGGHTVNVQVDISGVDGTAEGLEDAIRDTLSVEMRRLVHEAL